MDKFEQYHQYLADLFSLARDAMLDAFYEGHAKDVLSIKRIRLEVHRILNANGAENAFPANLKHVARFLDNEVAKVQTDFEEYPVLTHFLDNASFMTTGYEHSLVAEQNEALIAQLDAINPVMGAKEDDDMRRLESIVSRAIDRITTRVIEQSEDIGFLGKMASRIIALREDMLKAVTLSCGDLDRAKKYLGIYLQKHEQKLGAIVTKELKQILERIDKMKTIEKDTGRDFYLEM